MSADDSLVLFVSCLVQLLSGDWSGMLCVWKGIAAGEQIDRPHVSSVVFHP
jgi:hypothetical protein